MTDAAEGRDKRWMALILLLIRTAESKAHVKLGAEPATESSS